MQVIQKKKRLVLLDAHAILHRAYHALPDFSTAKGEPTGALYGLSAMLIKIFEDLKPDYVVACYDVKGPTYRHEAYKAYKAQRKTAEDDLVVQMKRSRDIFVALNIPIYDRQGFEADDILGTIVEQLRGDKKNKLQKADSGSRESTDYKSGDQIPLEIIIASGDMDTMQLVSGKDIQVYTLKKGISDTVMYDEDAVKARFGFSPELIADYKGLRGDPSDNIVGVPGIGEKTATILITTFGTVENIYKELEGNHEDKFKKAGITPRIIQLLKDNKEEAEFSKMLATIRRDVPINFQLPEKEFRENVDVDKVNVLWQELEFRTLTQRLKKVLGNLAESRFVDATDTFSVDTTKSLSNASGSVIGQYPERGAGVKSLTSVSTADIERTSLALWLVNSDLTNPTMEDILNFANTEDYERAKGFVFAELDKRGLRKVYEDIELPLISITHEMEKCGVKIDRSVLKSLSETYHAESSRLEKRIHELAGAVFNINSPKQLGEVLFDKLQLVTKNIKKTSGGARSTRESELEKLKELHPIVPLIFEYRELQKLLSTYIDAIPPLLDKNDRLHTDFVPSGTTTGRMASQNPNLQNIPIKSDLGKAIRNAFIADDGFVLAGFDYSQVELRIAAFLSGDEKMIGIFKRGEDVHSAVASFVFKVPQDKVTSDMRRKAKVINFGIIYGMGVRALKQNLGTTRDLAQNFLNDYFDTFSTLSGYLNKIKTEVNLKGYTETFFGRRRYFDGVKSKIPYIKARAERMAINAPIQGTGADVIKLAMVKVHEYIKKNKLENDVFPLLQVHDELVYEVRENKEKEVVSEIKNIMESVIDPKDIGGVVLKTSKSVGKNWGEMK
jgi:DNA polymerase I